MEEKFIYHTIKTFSDYLQAEKIFSESTTVLYTTILERFFKYCCEHQFELFLPDNWHWNDIRVRDLEAFLISNKDVKSKNHDTCVTYLSGIRSFYKYLQEKGIVEMNPYQHFVLSRHHHEMILIEDPEGAIREHFNKIKTDEFLGARNRLLLELVFGHALTAKQIASMTNIQINQNYNILIDFQDNQNIEYPASREFCELLNNYLKFLEALMDKNEFLNFWIDDRGNPMKPMTISRQVNKTLKIIGLGEMNFRLIREWSSQKFAEAGADIRSIQNMRKVKGIRRLKSLYKNDFLDLQRRFNGNHCRNK